MNVLEAISERRAVKHYDPNHEMSAEEEKTLLSHAILSPTAFNIQNWRLLVARDVELRKKIRAVAWDQSQVTDASLLIILCANLNSWRDNPAQYWVNAPKEVQDILVPALTQYYQGQEQVQRDEAMRSCGIIAQTLMLAAKGMGYDSCPMDGFDFDEVGKLINLPQDHVISMFVAVGKKIKEPWPRPGQLPLESIVLEDSF